MPTEEIGPAPEPEPESVEGEVEGRKPARRRETLAAVLSVLILVVIGFGIWAVLTQLGQPAPVTRRTVVLVIGADGQAVVPANAQAEVMAPGGVPVSQVNVTVGDRVQQGEIIAELSYPSVAAAKQQAQQQFAQAQQAYQQAQRTYQARVDQTRQELASAQSAVQAARQAQASAAQQPTALWSPVPPRVYFVQASPDTDQQDETNPSENTDLSQAQAQLQAAQQDYQQAQQDMQAALAPYRQAVYDARLALAQAQAGDRAAQLKAPVSGTIIELDVQPGQTLQGNPARAARIADLSQVQVSVPITDQQATLIEPKMPVVLTFDALPGEQLAGAVDELTSTPAAQGQPQQVALISFDNRAGHVRPTMQAHAAIEAGRAEGVLAVPSAAVSRDRNGNTVVYVRAGRGWRPVQVQTGLHGNRYTEIRSGLREGQEVRVPAR